MFKMIRQFTFHHPKQIIAPTLWLFLSQAFSILPAILAYMAIYLLGQAFYPPYTLDIALLIKIAVIGIAYVLLQYVVELISYYNTYGRAYHDTADKRIAYIQRATALFFLYFLAVFGGFLSILIPFLTSCGPHLPCVPHLSVAFYVVKGKASPEQFRRGFAVFSAACFSTR